MEIKKCIECNKISEHHFSEWYCDICHKFPHKKIKVEQQTHLWTMVQEDKIYYHSMGILIEGKYCIFLTRKLTDQSYIFKSKLRADKFCKKNNIIFAWREDVVDDLIINNIKSKIENILNKHITFIQKSFPI